MLLICPNCSARYHVPPGVWPADPDNPNDQTPRPCKVRCKMCQDIWTATPTLTEPEELSESEIIDEPVEQTEEYPVEEDYLSSSSSPFLPWVAGGIIAALIGAGVYFGRDHLRAIELPAITMPEISIPEIQMPKVDLSWMQLPGRPSSPLAIDVTHESSVLSNGQPIWQVHGFVRNKTDTPSPIPPIELQVLDEKGTVVDRWTFRPEAEDLASGAEWTFDTTRISPPESARSIRAKLKPPALARP